MGMCLIYTPHDDRCKGMGSHMHCHFCGWPMSLEWETEELRDENGCKFPGWEALHRCTNIECSKTELVMGMVREAPFGCDCRDWDF